MAAGHVDSTKQTTLVNNLEANVTADPEALQAVVEDHATQINVNYDAAAAHEAKTLQLYYTFYVNSDTGNDSNDGKNSGTPFATIRKAIDSVPNGAQGFLELDGSSPHIIDADIHVYNKAIYLQRINDSTVVTIHKLSSAIIWVVNSSISGAYNYDIFVEGRLFHVSGLSTITLGGFRPCIIRPLTETSDVEVCYWHYSGNAIYFHSSLSSFTGRRLRFQTDNFPSYSGTYNVFAQNLDNGIVLSKFWESTKDATVNWGLTENVLGGGLSQWY